MRVSMEGTEHIFCGFHDFFISYKSYNVVHRGPPFCESVNAFRHTLHKHLPLRQVPRIETLNNASPLSGGNALTDYQVNFFSTRVAPIDL